MTDKFFISLRNVNGAHSQKSRRAFQALGLSSGQPKVLYILKRNEGKLQKEIAMLSRIAQPTMTSLLKNMECRNWIRREPVYVSGGRRAYSLYLTEEGREMAEKIEDIVENLETVSLQGFTAEEKQSLLEMLCRVEENLIRFEFPKEP